MSRSSYTPGPEALRALSHPVRLRILGILRVEGPATATSLARRLDLNTGATSYHLRQLAEHGYITDDPDRGTGRERWWRAAHDSTTTSAADRGQDPDVEGAFLQTVATTYSSYLNQAVARHSALSPQWQEASTMSDWMARLTPEQALELRSRLRGTIETYFDEVEALGDTDPEALPFVVNLNAFVWPETPLPETPPGAGEES